MLGRDHVLYSNLRAVLLGFGPLGSVTIGRRRIALVGVNKLQIGHRIQQTTGDNRDNWPIG